MRFREWLGVGERRWKKAPDEEVRPAKTLWDWLQLLIVPAILVAVTFAWSAAQTRGDNKREDRRIAADRAAAEKARQDSTLQAYLDEMSGLMLDKKLLTSNQNDAVRAVARTVTLTVLRRLDGERKGEVVRFLHEARLRRGPTPLVVLEGADIRGAILAGADLGGADLDGAHLANAHLARADLSGAHLANAHLENADIWGAILANAHLARADLSDANLEGADLENADLWGAILANAHLARASLAYAMLVGAFLGGADLANANLGGAHLGGADLRSANLERTRNLDLDPFISGLSRVWRKAFLDSQKPFLDSLSPDELANFNLTPEKLAKFRREAGAA